jgi:hypothetical protein
MSPYAVHGRGVVYKVVKNADPRNAKRVQYKLINEKTAEELKRRLETKEFILLEEVDNIESKINANTG